MYMIFHAETLDIFRDGADNQGMTNTQSRKIAGHGILKSDPARSFSHCHICGNEPNKPYYRIVNEQLYEMCVGPIHHGHIMAHSSQSAWYYRAEADQIRLAERRGRLGK